MQAYIKLIILCIAAGLVSSAVHRGKEKTKILDGIKPFLFYVGIFYAGLIVIKKFARKTSVALLSCFASDSMLLYLLWAVPLILLGAVVPLILKKIFQKRADDFISMSLSIMISMGMIIWFLLGEINTRMLFCIIVGGGYFIISDHTFLQERGILLQLSGNKKVLPDDSSSCFFLDHFDGAVSAK